MGRENSGRGVTPPRSVKATPTDSGRSRASWLRSPDSHERPENKKSRWGYCFDGRATGAKTIGSQIFT